MSLTHPVFTKPWQILLREKETSAVKAEPLLWFESQQRRWGKVGRGLTLSWGHLSTSFRWYMIVLGGEEEGESEKNEQVLSSYLLSHTELSPLHVLSKLILTAGNIIIPILQIRKGVLRGITYLSFPKVCSG